MIQQNAKPHVSATQLEMVWRCPEQYRRRYVCQEVIPPGIALLEGSAYHAGAETNFRQKIDTHADLPAKDIVETSVAAFDAKVAGGYILSDEEAGRGDRIILGEAKDEVVKLAKAHAELQAPDYQPVAVEHATRIIFPTATHDLLGITDLRDDHGKVVDLKTAARKKPQSDADTSTQLTIYAAAYQIDTGRAPSEVRLDIVTKTKTAARQVLTSDRTAADYKTLIARVNATLQTIAALTEKGVEPWGPASPGSWACSPKFCGYFRTCPHVNSERIAAAESPEK